MSRQHVPKLQPEAPARIQGDHVQGRVIGAGIGNKSGWERLSVFDRAHRMGKLADKERCVDEESTKAEAGRALDRYLAGDQFAEGWKISNAGHFPAMDLNRVRVVGSPGSFVDHQIDVKNFMRALEGCLGTRDWMILRRVCGENYPVAETVMDISPGYKFSTAARFREALDALLEAMPVARRKARSRK